MGELLVFIAVTVAAAVFDIKKIVSQGLRREIFIYAALCAGALAIAVLYMPNMRNKSMMSYLLDLLRIRG